MPILRRTLPFVPMSTLSARSLLALGVLVIAVMLIPARASADPGPSPTLPTTSTTSTTSPTSPSSTSSPTSTSSTSSPTSTNATTTTTAPVPVTLTPAQVQQMSALQLQITQTGALLDQLAGTYETDSAQLGTLQQQETTTRAQIVVIRRKLETARLQLRADALLAYMGDIPLTQTNTLAFSRSNGAALTSEYEQVSMADITEVASAYEADAHTLSAADDSLSATESRVQSELTQIDDARQAAMAAASSQQASLAAVSAANDPSSPAYLAAQSAGRSAVAADRSAPPLPPALSAAIWAAASQVGVPYVWGGETPLPGPGAGFDCSGLVQWAYGQAGISLPRTAEEQYAATTPVALDQLQPGDLAFFSDGTTSVQHVAIYVGTGIVLQAPSTGSVVSFAPLWTSDLVGFGVPTIAAS